MNPHRFHTFNYGRIEITGLRMFHQNFTSKNRKKKKDGENIKFEGFYQVREKGKRLGGKVMKKADETG